MPNLANTQGNQRKPIRENTKRNQLIQKNKAEQLLMNEKRLQGLKDSLKLLDVYVNNRHMSMLQPAGNLDLYKSVCLNLDPYLRNRANNISVYDIEKIMLNDEEDSYEKLVSLYSAMNGYGGSVAMIIQCDGLSTHLYLCTNTNATQDTAGTLLINNFYGQFPGAKANKLNNQQKERLLSSFSDDYKNKYVTIKSLSMIPGRRENEREKGRQLTAQGYEKFIDTMRSHKYTLVILSQKVAGEAMDLAKSGYEDIYTSLSPYAKEQASFAQSESDSMNFTVSNGISKSTGTSISNSYGTNHNNSLAQGKGNNFGSSSSWEGIGFSSGSSWSTTRATSDGYSSNQSKGTSTTEGITSNIGEGETRTESTTKTISMTRDNKSVVDMLEKLDAMIQRIDESQLFGMWNSACYVICEDSSVASIAVSTLVSLLSGDNKSATQAYINTWSRVNDTSLILDYLGNLYHPQFSFDMFKETIDNNGNRTVQKLVDEYGNQVPSQTLTPALMISGKEIPIMMGIPSRSVAGIVVDKMAEFGRNISESWVKGLKRPIDFGNIYHMGLIEKTKTYLNLDAFSSHCFICGASGSGKSNTTYNLLYEFYKRNIPFLVVEPAKGEYKEEFAALKGINILTTNDGKYRRLKINPFEFHPNVHIREHLDRLNSTISACWPLYGTMPGLLKQAFERVYIEHGWDLEYSTRMIEKGSKFPTFKDLEKALTDIIDESPYSNTQKSDYKGALLYRVSSLNNGFEGQIFSSSTGISDKVLFDQTTIIDLSNIGSDETKSLIMGTLIIRLQEYRKATRTNFNSALKHVTVLEEAHNILKRCSQETGTDSGNMQGQSVKMLCGCIAEMRSVGEGFMIIDQSPTSVDESAIKNTAIKIVMRLPDKDDCEVMASALSLDDNQAKEISRLDIGVAAIYHVGWTNTVLAKMGNIWDKNILGKTKIEAYDSYNYLRVKGAVVSLLYNHILNKDFDFIQDDLYDLIEDLAGTKCPNFLPQAKRNEILEDTRFFFEDYAQLIKRKNFYDLKDKIGEFAYRYIHLDSLFKLMPLTLEYKEEVYNAADILSKQFTNIDFNVDHDVKVSDKDKKYVKKWADEFSSLLGKYLLLPEDIDETVIKWSTNPLKSNYFYDIFESIILYYHNIYEFEHIKDPYHLKYKNLHNILEMDFDYFNQ